MTFMIGIAIFLLCWIIGGSLFAFLLMRNIKDCVEEEWKL